MRAALGDADRESSLTQYDLAETALAEVIDDARTLSLFASERVFVAGNAEAALPRTRVDDDADEGESPARSADALAAYLKNPTPGVVLVFDAPRFDFEGEDKRRQDRVRKFYAAVGDPVEFKRASADEARREAACHGAPRGSEHRSGGAGVAGGSAGRRSCAHRRRSGEDVAVRRRAAGKRGESPRWCPMRAPPPFSRWSARWAAATVARSLEILDTLFRDGEYLPLALAFLSAQFRTALVAREAGLRSPQQIQGHFAKMGVPMWGSRAEQVYQTVSKFSKPQLERAMKLIFQADRDLRSARPDDRIVMEQFILQLTA